VAQRRLGRVLAVIGRLPDQPYLGQPGEYPGTRKLTIEDHAVIYRLQPDTADAATAGDVYVLRVFGPGQVRERL
jgi:plasmid stabilization system protein ParE